MRKLCGRGSEQTTHREMFLLVNHPPPFIYDILKYYELGFHNHLTPPHTTTNFFLRKIILFGQNSKPICNFNCSSSLHLIISLPVIVTSQFYSVSILKFKYVHSHVSYFSPTSERYYIHINFYPTV